MAHADYCCTPSMKAIMTDQNPPSASPFHSIRAIDYTVILVRDMAAMRRFYEGVLRFPLTRELSAGWIEYQIGGNTLALSRPGRTAKDAPTPAGSASLQLAFKVAVDDVDSAIVRCSSGIPMGICWRCMRRFDGGENRARPHPEEPRSGVSKDEWHQRGHMVRDGATRLLTMRVQEKICGGPRALPARVAALSSASATPNCRRADRYCSAPAG
jgi:catechol 2,3-dioxygenase-like lactoylglutathione lyase family enzyme